MTDVASRQEVDELRADVDALMKALAAFSGTAQAIVAGYNNRRRDDRVSLRSVPDDAATGA